MLEMSCCTCNAIIPPSINLPCSSNRLSYPASVYCPLRLAEGMSEPLFLIRYVPGTARDLLTTGCLYAPQEFAQSIHGHCGLHRFVRQWPAGRAGLGRESGC